MDPPSSQPSNTWMWVTIGFGAALIAVLAVTVAIVLLSRNGPSAGGEVSKSENATTQNQKSEAAAPPGQASTPATSAPIASGRNFDPRVVVIQFYDALGQGDGSTAAGFVVPGKRRSGPLSASALSQFYGSLDSPIEIVDVAVLPDGRVRTRYFYRLSNGRACNGVSFARVTISAHGIPLIAGIEAPSGC